MSTYPAPAGAPDDDGDELARQLHRRAEHSRRSEGGDPWTERQRDKARPPRSARLTSFLCLDAIGAAWHFDHDELDELEDEAADEPAARGRIRAVRNLLPRRTP